jgi:hypothetical protein
LIDITAVHASISAIRAYTHSFSDNIAFEPENLRGALLQLLHVLQKTHGDDRCRIAGSVSTCKRSWPSSGPRMLLLNTLAVA